MPDTDEYGQGIGLASLTDAANAETLADGIEQLVPRTIMRFTSASNRNATITSPQAGMVAFLTTEKLFTGYDGTAWVVLAAGTSTWTTISLASGFTHDGNSNGTAQYRVVNLFGELTVMLRGGVNITYPSGSIANSGVITSSALPTSARPTSLRTVTCACSAVSATITSLKLDAQTGGHLLLVGTSPTDKPPWVSLNGTFYSL